MQKHWLGLRSGTLPAVCGHGIVQALDPWMALGPLHTPHSRMLHLFEIWGPPACLKSAISRRGAWPWLGQRHGQPGGQHHFPTQVALGSLLKCEDSLSSSHLIVTLPIEKPGVSLRGRNGIVLLCFPRGIILKNFPPCFSSGERLPSH